ncbi:aldehyde dehydrogenase family protein [Sporomusa termitida]|uniref:NADP-dependent glyceraldehyde-3-phosphate dehydrogenase n=1 Tax=Sporomusa termitida TaxID=2377 RepID=A0A517DNE7_9FIRM|nr:aldehyde dehydrogenase family protein [Sporomusa termitida]QDR78879.1 NADP-dependent glyceraldehyde-3-phosphate dehydrogenase [Sporomusa termitida]
MQEYGLFIDGVWSTTGEKISVLNKATGEEIARISAAGAAEVTKAVDAAEQAFKTGKLEPYRRYEILLKASRLLRQNQTKMAEFLTQEVGKPIKEALAEVARAEQTLILSAEEAKRLTGEMVPLAGAPGCENRWAFTLRQPVGIVCAITPFNFPLNLACHKLGPAIAAGNTVVYKPATATPLSAVLLCEIFAEAGLPAGHLNLLTGAGGKLGQLLTAEERIGFYSFTGSPAVGKDLLRNAGFRRVALELGSNSANIVHNDTDIPAAAGLCAQYAFANAGQVCISCQRVYVQRRVYSEFCDQAVAYTRKLVMGDPLDPATDIGPMISGQEAARAETWVQAAVARGARLLTGGNRRGAWFEPTILTDVDATMSIVCQEAFAPVFSIIPYDTIEEAIAMVNDSVYGLQAGVFTGSLEIARLCALKLETGGVIINDGATFRTDNMPYGGIKESGIGREGPQYAVKEMTEEKLVVFKF